ncbi:phage tail tube protein [Streptomyces sp. NBRC 109706]|uniref:phage tail tube protein n=1 Tax=Streptomyces sp. NBRC 109706 TaxID=1550035 RepID=UPI0007853F5B|nr:phage tail tube protein [Streptomyces sp. NBRC 109706]
MAIGSGLGAQVGIAAESSYGVYTAPTRFVEFTSEGLKFQKTTAQSSGIAAGRLVDRSSRRVVTTVGAAGELAMEVFTRGMGVLFQALMGSTVAPEQQEETDAYLQEHLLADTFGKSLTVQKGVPLTTGVVSDFSVLGCKIISAEFSCEVGGMLTVSFELDGKTVDETQTLAAPSYPPMAPFHFGQMTLRTGVHGAEVARSGIRKVSVKFERPQATERYYANAGGLKAEPISNDKVKITGSLETDYTETTLADLFVSDAATSMVWEFAGAEIDEDYPELFRITLPAIHLDESTPVVDGPDVVKPNFSFTGLDDGVNPIRLDYQSTDTTL